MNKGKKPREKRSEVRARGGEGKDGGGGKREGGGAGRREVKKGGYIEGKVLVPSSGRTVCIE